MLNPGEHIGRYKVLGPLGRGGMSAVFRAYDPHLDRHVAIKALHADLAREESYRKRFQEEARALGNVSHPNLVQIYAVGQQGEISYYAMELVDGLPLSRLLRPKRGLAVEEALAIFSQFLQGLEAVHKAGIIHRDIKPGNIMADRSGRVRLMDFGLARRADRQTLTLAGSVIGTPEYMSPEQARGKAVDARTDLYSAGVVLHEMLSGNPPFTGKDTISILRQHVETPPPALARLNPGLPVELVAIAHRLLAKKPEQRYSSAGEVLAALAKVPAGRRKPQEVVAALVASVPDGRGETREMPRTPVSWETATPAQAAESVVASKVLYRREQIRTGIALGAAVVAVLALLLAILSVLRGPTRPVEPTPSTPAAVAPAPTPEESVLWKVTLRDGTSFVGRYLKSLPSEESYVFRDRSGKDVKVSWKKVKSWQKGGGAE